MTRKHIVVDYLTWCELDYIKNMIGATSFDDMFRKLYLNMRGGAMKLHKEYVEKEHQLMNVQYGGYVPKDLYRENQPATED